MNRNPHEFQNQYPQGSGAYTLSEYTAKTFLWMMLGLFVTFFIAIGLWMTGMVYIAMRFHLVWLIVTLVLSFTMAARIERMSVGGARAIFFAFSVLFGITLSVYLLYYEVTSVIFVFLMTAVYFGALAAYGHFTHRDLSNLGSILRVGLIFLIVMGALMWLFPFFSVFDRVTCLIGIAIFLAYTAYDTQKIRQYYYYYAGYPDMLEKASIFSALQLYLDFLNLFLYLLRFMGNRRND